MRKSKSKKINQNKGFTLAESMMVLAMLSVIIVLVMPVMTSRKIMPEQEQNSVTCIKKEGAANTSSMACAAVEDLCVGNQAKSCSSLVYFADNGTTAEKAAARKVLHEVCDKGGREACKYLVDSCKKDAAVCDISTTTDDLRHYLAMSNTSGNMGRAIVKEIANGYYLLGNSNITAELVSSCNGGNDKTSCSILIENCNNGYGCSNAYNANANRSCKQINEKWPTAIGKNQKKNDSYTLLPDNTSTFSAYCDMTTDSGGWTQIYDVNLPSGPTAWSVYSHIPYSLDLTNKPMSFSRIAYKLTLNSDFVWTSMDDFTGAQLAQTGIPIDWVWDTSVTNLNIISGTSDVMTQMGQSSGRIEFWSHCYGPTGGNSSLYDYDDSVSLGSPDCFGSMQVHNGTNTIWAFNQWSGSTYPIDVGFGNNTLKVMHRIAGSTIHPDWTYADNGPDFTVRNLKVYIK